jgi:hypothetical protein
MKKSKLGELLLRSGVGGALGGLFNAAHCWATLSHSEIHWHIIPAGAVHGALLALIAVLSSALVLERSLPVRLLVLPFVAWIAGWLSFEALSLSLGWGDMMFEVWTRPKNILGPYGNFGLVVAWAFLGWAILRWLRSPRLLVHLACAVSAGIWGSLWWWISMDTEHWYYSLIHGVVWGSLVGLGVWSIRRQGQDSPHDT